MNTPQLVVIDDEADLGSLVCDVAEQSGFGVSQFISSRQFMEQYNGCVDVIVLDLMMPDIDGIEVIRFLSQKQCPAQIILMSGFDSTVLLNLNRLLKIMSCWSFFSPRSVFLTDRPGLWVCG